MKAHGIKVREKGRGEVASVTYAQWNARHQISSRKMYWTNGRRNES